jgi:hypothetical protein
LEIELLNPWSITALKIFWANGLAREVDWNPLKNLVRDILDFHILCTHGNPASVPARNATRNIPRQINPPEAVASVRLVSIGRDRARTRVIRHVNQEVCDPRGLELVDRVHNVKLKLDRVPCERAEKHLQARRNALSWEDRSSRNAYDACVIPR